MSHLEQLAAEAAPALQKLIASGAVKCSPPCNVSPPPGKRQHSLDWEQRRRQRILMQRLRAERQGKSVAEFPPRQRAPRVFGLTRAEARRRKRELQKNLTNERKRRIGLEVKLET